MSTAPLHPAAHDQPPRNRTTDERRAWTGPAVLGAGFRPFFLCAGLWAALAMLLWLPMITGRLDLPSRMAPVDWHVHALLYGYVPGVLGGFLLTAIPNWTGRPPVVGWPLAGLVLVWAAGRLAVTGSALLPAAVAAAIDLAFLPLLAAVGLREILAGRNWRNLPVLGGLLMLAAGNLVFHLDAGSGTAAQGPGARIGLAVTVFLVLLIGGRIVPGFTRSWLAQRGPGRLPPALGRFDALALGAGGAALAAWIAAPDHPLARGLCLAAGLLHLARLARWCGWRTVREPLVAILHVGYLFAPLGFLLAGAPAIPLSAAVHAWTVGLIGTMTLAVMTRASLGHTGRPLKAGAAVVAIYAAVLAAALLRIHAAVAPQETLLAASGLLWLAGFAGFASVFFPVLTSPRRPPAG